MNFKGFIRELFPSSDKLRHVVKSISYRIYSSCITITIAILVTGNTAFSVSIGLIDFVTKIFTYYIHERIWFHIPFGLKRPRKVRNHIAWTHTENSYAEIQVFQDETSESIKKIKILKNHLEYLAIVSEYNFKTGKKFIDTISSKNLHNIEATLNIKING